MEDIAVGEEFCDLNDVSGRFLATFECVLFLALRSAVKKNVKSWLT